MMGPLSKTKHRNKYIAVITDRYSKLTEAIPKTRNATRISNICIERGVASFGLSSTVLTDNDALFTCRFFFVLCRGPDVKTVETSVYYPQANGQVKRFNEFMISKLKHYVRIMKKIGTRSCFP